MRRPSRQGLLPVCTHPTTLSLTANLKFRKTNLLYPTLTLFQRFRADIGKPQNKLMLILMLTATVFCTKAQDIRSKMHIYFQEVRNGNYPPVPEALLSAQYQDSSGIILEPFLKDSVPDVRTRAVELIYTISSRSDKPITRQRGVLSLLGRCTDSDIGIRARTLDLLKEFSRQDFPAQAADSVKKFIRSKTMPIDRLIKLAGFLQLRKLSEDVRPWSQPGNPTRIRWAAILALSRMEDPWATAEMMKRARRLPINDEVVYQVLPDLLYTRQPEAFNFAIAALNSNEKSCSSADAENEVPILCGYRIMELLAPLIADYPLELEPSGDIRTSDYAATLQNVRQWFLNNKSYIILKDKY